MKCITILFLISMAITPLAIAEEIQDLQQRASFAYEQMMKAKREAKVLSNDAADAEKQRQRAEQELENATTAAEAARQRSNASNSALDQTILQWNQTSEALAQKWGSTER